jgi:penicillin-binding protein 1A
VKAWVGSRNYQDDKFDHVAQAHRQPGSTFKPFVYGAAFEAGARPTDTFIDEPVTIQVDKNQYWTPGDVHEATHQPMTLREGLVLSKNTITAQVMQQVGPARVAQLARAMGVRQSPLQEVPSLALGTSPVSLREMVSSYATIANNGGYIEPIVVLSVEDRNHHVLEQFHPKLPEQTLNADVSQVLLDVMRGVIDEGTAVGLRSRFGIPADVDLAGKTGTTQNYTDGWFIAMHPQLVMGAWMGYNDPRLTMHSDYWGQGAHNALFIVGDFIKRSLGNGTLDAKAKFLVPKDMSKGTGTDSGIWNPLVGRVNDWWNSMFSPGPNSGNDTAALAEVTSVPPAPSMPEVPAMPEPPAVPEPLQLPDSGVLPAAPSRAPDAAVLGAAPSVPARVPDAIIPAPQSRPVPDTSGSSSVASTTRIPQPALGTPPANIDALPGVASWQRVPAPRPQRERSAPMIGGGSGAGSGAGTGSRVGSDGSGSNGNRSYGSSSSGSGSNSAGTSGSAVSPRMPAPSSLAQSAPSEPEQSSAASGSAHYRAPARETRESVTPPSSEQHSYQYNSGDTVESSSGVSQATGSASASSSSPSE